MNPKKNIQRNTWQLWPNFEGARYHTIAFPSYSRVAKRSINGWLSHSFHGFHETGPFPRWSCLPNVGRLETTPQVLHILHRLAQDAVKNYIVASADVIFLAGNHAPSAFLTLEKIGDLMWGMVAELKHRPRWMWQPW